MQSKQTFWACAKATCWRSLTRKQPLVPCVKLNSPSHENKFYYVFTIYSVHNRNFCEKYGRPIKSFFQISHTMTEQQLLLLNSFIFSHLFHTFIFSPQGISKKVTLLLFNFIPFLKITIILLYQKMFSCLRISYQSTSWYWMKQFVTTWNKVFWLFLLRLVNYVRFFDMNGF